MKAASIRTYGKNVPLEMVEVPTPALRPNDVLIKIHAASVNPIDFKIREGMIRPILPYQVPLILGNDLSGTVEQVGPAVTTWRPGDAVYSRPDKLRIGTFAEFIAVDAGDVALKPARLTHSEAASLPLVGLTSWQALLDIAVLKAGQEVLILAGSGGIGTFAIQLAHHVKARVTTTAGKASEELLRSLGADRVIDYRTTDFASEGRQYDVVFDTQGGDALTKSISITRRGGWVVSIAGTPSRSNLKGFDINPVVGFMLDLVTWPIRHRARSAGVNYTYLFMEPSGAELKKIADLVDQGIIKPRVDRVFPFEQAGAALDYVQTGRAKGKVVVSIIPDS